MITVVCKQCKKEFESYACQKRKFCSVKCYNQFRQSAQGIKEEAERKAQGKKVSVAKQRPKAKAKTRRTCSTCKHCVRSRGKYGDRNCYVCRNRASEFYGAFLNVDEDGLARKFVTWQGCAEWAGKCVINSAS